MLPVDSWGSPTDSPAPGLATQQLWPSARSSLRTRLITTVQLLTVVAVMAQCSRPGGSETKTCSSLRVRALGAETSSAKAAVSFVCLASDWVQNHTRELGPEKSVHIFLHSPLLQLSLAATHCLIFSTLAEIPGAKGRCPGVRVHGGSGQNQRNTVEFCLILDSSSIQ